ncbi:hypothetical protein T12_14482 [Trichinella patagoniensis]|uniref:Uncharacterized protein n=1 Tax=Trichinella patagoniensis TaxID=990121 RepID=A0A0V0Z8B9_9BILA|nr:hypothetical protein T12_14482 [Trichinella patagoniensis]
MSIVCHQTGNISLISSNPVPSDSGRSLQQCVRKRMLLVFSLTVACAAETSGYLEGDGRGPQSTDCCRYIMPVNDCRSSSAADDHIIRWLVVNRGFFTVIVGSTF